MLRFLDRSTLPQVDLALQPWYRIVSARPRTHSHPSRNSFPEAHPLYLPSFTGFHQSQKVPWWLPQGQQLGPAAPASCAEPGNEFLDLFLDCFEMNCTGS